MRSPRWSLRASSTVSTGSPSSDRRAPFLSLEGYKPPSWASGLHLVPSERYVLGMFPTPIHRWHLPGVPEGTERDDLSGMQLSGNKVRKLEFLMADAKRRGCDSVITIGGIQSNHCRATAVAARYLGLDPYLILRNNKVDAEKDPGLTGNLLVERMVGAHIEQCTKGEYAKHGSVALGEMLRARLTAEGRKPYLIKVGGSDSLGVWGYLECIREIEWQLQQGESAGAGRFDAIAMACGSGATTAGLALGASLSGMGSSVIGYTVCDDEEYFYNYIQELYDGLTEGKGVQNSRELLTAVDVKGAGYALSTPEELECMRDVALATGVVLDPVYSGKAVYGLLRDMQADPAAWKGKRVLFIHTGGLLGMYEKEQQLQPLVEGLGRASRFPL